jgi:hypothetical protein
MNKHILAAWTITIIWLVVLLVGLFGSEIRIRDVVVDVVDVPSVVVVAPSAAAATAIVAWFGFRE